jgi:plasmid stabilization system protein ParE
MAHQVRISAKALADVEEALAWLAERSPQAAVRWHAGLMEKVESLANNPEGCPLAVEAKMLGVELRELLFGKRRGVYRILFKVEGDVVNVVHVRHRARDWLKPEEL